MTRNVRDAVCILLESGVFARVFQVALPLHELRDNRPGGNLDTQARESVSVDRRVEQTEIPRYANTPVPRS